MSNDAAVSKFLSYVLRHDPASIGLTLDPQGWVEVNDLLERATTPGLSLDRATLHRVVAENDKQRFTFSEEGDRIRAAQGHSVKVELGLPPVNPPTVLYHGTADRFIGSILREGLRPQSRQQVHLSLDVATAAAVGTRHGRPVVLLIDAAGMQRDGRLFHRADNGVWLTDEVPPNYISRTT